MRKSISVKNKSSLEKGKCKRKKFLPFLNAVRDYLRSYRINCYAICYSFLIVDNLLHY